jgi:RimJ/RimL family protein N-acetyltransferase
MEITLPVYTRRLVIRYLEETDLEPHYLMMSDPEVVRYLYEEPFVDPEKAMAHLKPRIDGRTLRVDGDWINFAVEAIDADTLKKFVGELGLGLFSLENRSYQIGYVLTRDAQGNGFASEGVRELLRVAFETLNAHRVFARLDSRNSKSEQLLARIGMVKEGTFRETEYIKGEWTSETVYSLLSNDWFLTKKMIA